MENMVNLEAANFDAVHTDVRRTDLDGTAALRVTKRDKLNLFDQNTHAKLHGAGSTMERLRADC